jgi:hypothetical protein
LLFICILVLNDVRYDHIYAKGCSQLPPQSVVHPLPPSTVDIPKIRFCDSHSHLPCASTKSRQQTIQKAISDKQAIASDKFCRLKLARDVHAGMEILHLFIMDLLGRQSSAAKIFNTMTREEYVTNARYEAIVCNYIL